MNLLAPFLSNVGLWSARTAVVAPDGVKATFGDIARWSARLASRWAGQGIGAGDRVLVAMPLGVALYVAIAALWRLGAVVVFPEPALGVAGLRHAAKATAPKAFLSAGWFRCLQILPELWRVPRRLQVDAGAQGADPLCEAGRDHPALISFTSGSTGAPKAIVRSHGFLAAQNACVGELLNVGGAPQTDLVAFPVFVIANLGLGVTSVLPNWKLSRHDQAQSGAIARLVAEQRVTRALLPPSICETLGEGGPVTGLASILTGGGPVFPDTLQKLAAALSISDITAVYGSTEAEPIAHQRFDEISAADWSLMREGGGLLAGRPIAQIRLALVEDEILVAGDHVNKAYLDPSADAETKVRREGEIWHRTGDAGRLDEKGRLWLLGRRNARAGRFFPFEIETAARLWPGVRQVALVPGGDPPVLAIAGEAAHKALWAGKAEALGGLKILILDSIPLDRRHRSKIDYAALTRLTVQNRGR